MPVVSKAQQGFMAMSKTAAGRAALRKHGKKPAPRGVADEFLKASKGVHDLPQHKGDK